MTAARLPRRGQGGFTLIELMVSLIISSVLVAMILSIFANMSSAYRTQQQVAELQQVLSAGQDWIESDLRQAGYKCPQGFTWAGGDATKVPALAITDGGNDPDQLAVFYGDPTAQAMVTTAAPLPFGAQALTTLTVDSPDRFVAGDLVLFSVGLETGGPVSPTTGVRPPEEPPVSEPLTGGAKIGVYYACVLQIESINGNQFTFATGGTWGTATNHQCTYASGPDEQANANPSATRMLYRFAARGYRIDPARKELSVFQMSNTGGLTNTDWQDLGIGITDFQIASRWFESFGPVVNDQVDNGDVDTDPKRNWYSGSAQAAQALKSARPDPNADNMTAALQVTISLVVRTTREVTDSAITASTPALIDPARPDFGEIGNKSAFALAGVPDTSRPTELRGRHIYRYSTVKVDTRNLGMGR